MRMQPFLLSLLIALAVGGISGGLAGAFTSDDNGQPSLAGAVAGGPAGDLAQGGQSQGGEGLSREDIRERIQSGEVSPEDLARLRQQAQGQTDTQGEGSSATRIGTIDAIDGNTLTLATASGTESILVGNEAEVQVFQSGDLADLSTGQQVTILGQRSESGVTARALVITPAGAEFNLFSGLGGRGRAGGGPGGFGGGQGGFGGFGGALVGIIEAVDGGAVTVNTQQGPLVADVTSDTVIQVMAEAAIGDLSPGQQVTITGTAHENGGFTAETIVVTPNLLEIFGGAFGGAEGGFGGAS